MASLRLRRPGAFEFFAEFTKASDAPATNAHAHAAAAAAAAMTRRGPIVRFVVHPNLTVHLQRLPRELLLAAAPPPAAATTAAHGADGDDEDDDGGFGGAGAQRLYLAAERELEELLPGLAPRGAAAGSGPSRWRASRCRRS